MNQDALRGLALGLTMTTSALAVGDPESPISETGDGRG